MFKKWFWLKALVALIVIGGLVAAGVGIYRAGWWQGYRLGQVTVGEDEGEETLHPHRFDRFRSFRGFGFPHHRSRFGFTPMWFGGGLFLRIGLLLAVLALIGGLFRRHAWRAACGPARRYWHHGHPHHGHPHHGRSAGEKESFVGKTKPDAQTDATAGDVDEQ